MNLEVTFKQLFFDKDGLTLEEVQALKNQEATQTKKRQKDNFFRDLYQFSLDGCFSASERTSLNNNPWVKYKNLDLTFLENLKWIDHFITVSQNWDQLSEGDQIVYLNELVQIGKNNQNSYQYLSGKIQEVLNCLKNIFKNTQSIVMKEKVVETLLLITQGEADLDGIFKDLKTEGGDNEAVLADILVELYLKTFKVEVVEPLSPNGNSESSKYLQWIKSNFDLVSEKVLTLTILEKYRNSQGSKKIMLSTLYSDLRRDSLIWRASDAYYYSSSFDSPDLYMEVKNICDGLSQATSTSQIEELLGQFDQIDQQNPEFSIECPRLDVELYARLSYLYAIDQSDYYLGRMKEYNGLFNRDLFEMGTYGLDPNSKEFIKIKEQFLEIAVRQIDKYILSSDGISRSTEFVVLLRVLNDLKDIAGSSQYLKRMLGRKSIKDLERKINPYGISGYKEPEAIQLENWIKENF